jgi:molybdopterin synthase catalytic subunit
MDDWIDILGKPLDVATAVSFVTEPNAGGIAVFLGTTRAEQTPKNRSLLALDYEAYLDMAQGQLHELAREAGRRWPILKLALLHRIGRVAVGEPSVIVAVSTPHRSEAFDACRWLIDTLKAEVAIWKKEIWADGTATWKDA